MYSTIVHLPPAHSEDSITFSIAKHLLPMNIALVEPKNRNNLATILRTGQNFDVKAIFVIGGFVRDQYKGNIPKFSHQMDTQDGLSAVTLLYFETIDSFLSHLPAQTTLVLVEALPEAENLKEFQHPFNATYVFGREAKGLMKSDIDTIRDFISRLHENIPLKFREKDPKTAHLRFVKIDTPESLNLGVAASIVMYDRDSKLLT